MNKKTLFTIIIIIALLLAGAGIVYWYWQKQTHSLEQGITLQEDKALAPEESGGPLGGGLQVETDATEEEAPAPQQSDVKLVSVARYFVERWGTYSNQSDFQNIRDLRPVMTEDFFNEVYGRYQPMSDKDLVKVDYEGYETKVVSIDWEVQSDQEAVALVTTNRRHLTDAGIETYPQDIRVTLIKQAGNWVVAAAVWQER